LIRDAGERGHAGDIVPCFFKEDATRAEVPFHNSIISDFMVDQDRLERNLLELFVHPENAKWFSITYVITFGVNVASEQKQA